MVLEFVSHLVDEMHTVLDNCSKKEIAKITAGTTYDWAADCAKTSQPVHTVKEGAVLSHTYAVENQQLMENQLRKAGYRLAKLLNKVLK